MPDLGKYGFEVLSAYGFSLVLMAGLIWLTWRASRAAVRRLEVAEAQSDEH